MSKSEHRQSSTYDEVQQPNVCDVPQLSRMSCAFCRARKLKCDKTTPKCGSCSRYKHQCVYDATRKVGASRSRKRGYVSALQERLAQIETSLLKQESTESNELVQVGPEICASMVSDSDVDMISQDTVRELEEVYFQKIHESTPMFHRARYLAATELELGLQPPIYLRHAVLALGACASPKYAGLQERFYRSSREALEFVEMNDHHLDMVSVEQAQTWILIATYEFRRMHFHRSWMSTGRAVRLVQMMDLHRMDKKDVGSLPRILPPAKDWTAEEERRRTFWMAFCLDRSAAIGHGWPMTIDDQDIVTRLPAPDEAFQSCTETASLFLREAMTTEGAASLSSFAGVVAMTGIGSIRLTALKRSNLSSAEYGEAWGGLDSNLVRPLLVPDHLRVPSMKWDPNLYYLNMVANAVTIRIHQEAVAKVGVKSLHSDALRESGRIRLESALEIASIMRASCHVDLSAINPFTSFCLYVGATTLARTKNTELDEHQKNSLHFLLTAMNYLEEVNPLTTAFLQDLKDEFPDLTASFSGLNVGGGVRKGASSPESMEHSQNRKKSQTCCASMTPRSASTDSKPLSMAFASHDSILGQEWIASDEQQQLFEAINDSQYHIPDSYPVRPEDQLFGGMFLSPAEPGMD